MPPQKRLGLGLAFNRLQRTSGKYQHTAGLYPIRRAVEHSALDCCQIIDLFDVDPLQHIGMAAHGAGGAARRIEQDGVIRCGWFPIHYVGSDPLCIQLGALQIGHQPVHPPRRIIERGDGETRSR